MELRFRCRCPDSCWGSPLWAPESEGQPRLHGLGITVCLSSSGPRASVFGCLTYFMMIVIALLQQVILTNLRALVPLKHHPSKRYCCTVCFPLGAASRASSTLHVLQPPRFLRFDFFSLLRSAAGRPGWWRPREQWALPFLTLSAAGWLLWPAPAGLQQGQLLLLPVDLAVTPSARRGQGLPGWGLQSQVSHLGSWQPSLSCGIARKPLCD